jgi:hypothetical protein
VAFALQKVNGGSEGELNRRLGAQKSPPIGSLASHVFSVDADGDIVRGALINPSFRPERSGKPEFSLYNLAGCWIPACARMTEK